MNRRYALLLALLSLIMIGVFAACTAGTPRQAANVQESTPSPTSTAAPPAPSPTVPRPPAPITVSVTSKPAGAALFLDGEQIATAPADLALAPGEYQLIARAEGYKDAARTLSVAPGEPSALAVELDPLPARLRVLANRKGAQVSIDGEPAGKAPAWRKLEPGSYKVVVRLKGHRSWSKRVTLAPDSGRQLTARLAPLPGKLVVKARGEKVRVSVDGKRRGRGSVTLKVSPGKHRVTARLKGYRIFDKRVRVGPGETVRVRAVQKPLRARLRVVVKPAKAKVRIDGRSYGRGPATARLKHGRHTIVASLGGHTTWKRRITLRPGESRRVTPVLRQLTYAPKLPNRPLAVMIENHPNARPQSGLDYADVVLEAPAEFGISRFIAYFISRDVPVIGPVRSTRPYFVLWAKEFNPLYFHAGGGPGAAALADRIGMSRINALWHGYGFYRTTDRVAPHNLYTSTQNLRNAVRARGMGFNAGTWGGFRFKTPGTQLGPNPASYIRINFNEYYYAEWRWDASRGVYWRWMQGEPAIERNTGAQITGTAVIVRVHNVGRIAGDAKAREEVQVYGSGAAYIFQDGRMTRATWYKEDVNSPTVYYDRQGNRIAFNKGGIWIQAIPQYGSVDWE